MTHPTAAGHRLGTVIMYHPSRRTGVDRIAGECLPLRAELVEDPDPTGPPSPLRTAKVAWGAVDPEATHHLVLQDDVHLCADFAEHAATLVDRYPDHAISLGVLWVSPYNSYRVRQAAIGGYPTVRLAPWEWVPSLGLILPAELSRDLAEFLRGFPDITRDDDEHIAVFCAKRNIPVIAAVPHLLDHSTRPSVAGNDSHGIRLAVSFINESIDPDHWNGPPLTDPAMAGELGYAVELVNSRCNLRLRRGDGAEAAEQPFTWPWRPWSRLLDVHDKSIMDAIVAPPEQLGEAIATEVWAAGFLLGARSRHEADRHPGHNAAAVREATNIEALRSWITAGLRPEDQAALGRQGCEAAAEWCRLAVEAGRQHTTTPPVPVGPQPIPADNAERQRIVERMAAREARQLLQTAPEALPDIRLEIKSCAEHPDPGQVTRNLPVRWLAEHMNDSAAQHPRLVALECERLEPRSLVGLANLVLSGWHGIAETRAATAARLRETGLDWDAVLREVDAAEQRFTEGDAPVLTLPAASRTADDRFGFVSPHADAQISAWDSSYRDMRTRGVLDIGL